VKSVEKLADFSVSVMLSVGHFYRLIGTGFIEEDVPAFIYHDMFSLILRYYFVSLDGIRCFECCR